MWTARGTLSNKNFFQITYKQLNNFNVKFHELRMGKPSYDYWIDDKAFNVQDFFMTDVRTGETKSMTL